MRVAPEDSISPKPKYGWGSFTPTVLQRVNNPKCLLFWMCVSIFGQRLGFSLFPSIITTISLRFNLTTTQIGFIQSFNDVAGLLITILISHYGEKGHKGRWLGVSYIVCFVALFLFTVPQWLSAPYLPEATPINGSEKGLALCNAEPGIVRNCSTAEQRSSWASAELWIFTLAATLAACGAMPSQIVGTPYLDENVMQSSSALYLAFPFAAGLVASALGFSIGSQFLKIYGDFYRVDTSAIALPPRDSPAYYGAWWMGYLVAMPILFLSIIPIFGFSRELPQKAKYRAQDVDQTHSGDEHHFGGKWRDYPRALKILFTNPVFCLSTLRAALQLFFVSGIITFLPLYFEQIQQFPRSAAGMITGLLLLVPVVFGAILGSVLVKRFKLTAKSLLKLCTLMTFIGFFPGLGFLLSCPTPAYSGVTRGYDTTLEVNRSDFYLNDTCNADCYCDENQDRPVCFKEARLLFYSPCFAGCSEYDKNTSTFSNCRCLAMYHQAGPEAVLKDGLCPLTSKCQKNAYVICILLALGFFVGGIETQPSFQLSLRTVPFSQRTMAVGVKGIFIKLFGFIPGPITFGYALDKSCLKHKLGRCGQRGGCIKYDHESVTQQLLVVYLAVAGICFVCNLLSLVLYKPPKGKSYAQKMKKLGREEKETPPF